MLGEKYLIISETERKNETYSRFARGCQLEGNWFAKLNWVLEERGNGGALLPARSSKWRSQNRLVCASTTCLLVCTFGKNIHPFNACAYHCNGICIGACDETDSSMYPDMRQKEKDAANLEREKERKGNLKNTLNRSWKSTDSWRKSVKGTANWNSRERPQADRYAFSSGSFPRLKMLEGEQSIQLYWFTGIISSTSLTLT